LPSNSFVRLIRPPKAAHRMTERRTVREISKHLASGRVSSVSLVEEYFGRIESLDKKLNCYITLLKEEAAKWAREADERYRKGSPLSPIDGVPIAVKDLIYIQGVRCTAGSKILADNIATYDAPLITRLRSKGVVFLGTANLHEFASGVTNDNPHFGPVHNPWDLERISGGSSGGSAAAVSAGLAAMGIGSDTSGSIRIPASLCGVVGLKPTYGRISRVGVIPLAPSLDTIGTLSNSAWDAAALVGAMAGHDEGDITTTDVPVPDFLSGLGGELPKLKVGVPKKESWGLVDTAVETEFSRFVDRLVSLGCELTEEELEIERAREIWAPIRRAEAAAFHERWLAESPEKYGDDVRKLLEEGMKIPAVRYINAQNSRPLFTQDSLKAMEGLDLLVMPSTPAVAPLIGESVVTINGKELPVFSALNGLTLPFNVLGFPALSLPIGMAHGLPVGGQIVGRPFDESTVCKLAFAYEEKFGLFPSPPVG
jgi:aspartyl-tRNA(Asn)/glutamyl-tRNA(Gln) amidotransferase subunit A